MNEATSDVRRGIIWTLSWWTPFKNLTLLRKLFWLLIVTKTSKRKLKTGRQIGPYYLHRKKKNLINTSSDQQVTLDNNNVEEVQEFIYLGSKITSDGNSEMDVLHRLPNARVAFTALQNWNLFYITHQKSQVHYFPFFLDYARACIITY